MTRRRDNGRGSQGLCDAPAAARGTAATPASPLRYYGGLQSHARKIAELLPPHDRYAEPFAGGASVILSKPASETEYLSDINPDLVNFWRVVQRPDSRRRLLERVELTPYGRAVYRDCIAALREGGGDAVRRAWAFLVCSNQSRNGHGTRESYWSYGKGNTNANAESWARLSARLERAGRRLRDVQIECLPYEEILQRFDARRAVVLLDPPYLPTTRVSAKVYRHEFTHDNHRRLLALATRSRAKTVICGYADDLYEEALAGWNRVEMKGRSFANPCGSGGKRPTRTLVLWANFDLPVGLRMQKLFESCKLYR